MAQVQILQIPLLTLIQCIMSGNVSLEPAGFQFEIDSSVISVLTRYMPRVKARKEKSLLSNSDVNGEVEEVRHCILFLATTFDQWDPLGAARRYRSVALAQGRS
jgi:hypothetical protein